VEFILLRTNFRQVSLLSPSASELVHAPTKDYAGTVGSSCKDTYGQVDLVWYSHTAWLVLPFSEYRLPDQISV